MTAQMMIAKASVSTKKNAHLELRRQRGLSKGETMGLRGNIGMSLGGVSGASSRNEGRT